MRKKDGPTARIIERARTEPGGIIRWHEAEDEYCSASSVARHERMQYNSLRSRGHKYPSAHYHSSVGRVLKKYFLKVEGTKGFYVLKESITENDPLDHVIVNNFNRDFGFNGYLGSHSAPRAWGQTLKVEFAKPYLIKMSQVQPYPQVI